MITPDSLEDTLRKISNAEYRKLYLGIGKGIEVFHDAEVEGRENCVYIGVEIDDREFARSIGRYSRLDSELQDQISLMQHDATQLPKQFVAQFDEVYIFYPWNEFTSRYEASALSEFLIANKGAASYLKSFLRQNGKVIIYMHPHEGIRDHEKPVGKQVLRALIDNLDCGVFSSIDKTPMLQHPVSSVGLGYRQEGPSASIRTTLVY